MHSLYVWIGKWEQRIVSVLKLVPNTGIHGWATGTSLQSREKSGREAAQYHLNIVEVSSTNRRCSDTVALNEG